MKKDFHKKFHLFIGFFGVFLVFTSDLYGLSDDGALFMRIIGGVMVFAGMFVSWILLALFLMKKRK